MGLFGSAGALGFLSAFGLSGSAGARGFLAGLGLFGSAGALGFFGALVFGYFTSSISASCTSACVTFSMIGFACMDNCSGV